jgi:hypothetical protein
MKVFLTTLITVFAGSLGVAQTTTNLTITPSTSTPGLFDCKNIQGVAQDAAPGFPFGSFKSSGEETTCTSGGSPTYKTDMYFTPENLFGRMVELGEVTGISYWTKKSSTHTTNPTDWYLVIYTQKYQGQTVSFYGARINAEPYFAINLSDPAGTWNQWSTGGTNNQLRFFESTYGYFGSYTDPNFASFISGSSLTGSHSTVPVPYNTQQILYFSIQTASSAVGFTGQVDGLRIQLSDGSVAAINFEPFLVPTDKDSCKNGGWMNLDRPDGSTFKNQGDCIQYVNTGK